MTNPEKKRRRQHLVNQAFDGNKLRNYTFDSASDMNSECMKKAKNYAENFEYFYNQGVGLLLLGSIGTGKTYAAACIANALIEKEKLVWFTSFSKISSDMYERKNKNEFIKTFRKPALLILDDYAVERDSNYINEVVYSVINERYLYELPIIITTNAPFQSFINSDSGTERRIGSRILETCIPITFKGSDKRIQKSQILKERNNDILLGKVSVENQDMIQKVLKQEAGYSEYPNYE